MDAVSFIQTPVWINEALLVEVLYTMKTKCLAGI